jgi:hypothetical protein
MMSVGVALVICTVRYLHRNSIPFAKAATVQSGTYGMPGQSTSEFPAFFLSSKCFLSSTTSN